MQLTITLILFCYSTIVIVISKYYDGPMRPYEFGYSIKRNQHKYEKIDQNGIIMGEFGFITADGVYHITVYATDGNGNFRIISMKNIKIGLLEKNTQPKSSKTAVTITRLTTKTTTRIPLFSRTVIPQDFTAKKFLPSDYVSCSSCLIPNEQGNQNVDSILFHHTQDQTGSFAKITTSSTADKTHDNNLQSYKDGPLKPHGLFEPLSKKINGRFDGTTYTNQNYFPLLNSLNSSNKVTSTNEIKESDQFPNDDTNYPKSDTSRTTKKPQTKVAAQGRNQTLKLQFNREFPLGKLVGEGVNDLLYKFNYTVGYHGHHEKGNYEGVKDGGYHFVGRDGLRRTVDYLANEFGFQPYLKYDKTDDENIPKAETEKETGLKGYEFRWFNRPGN